jgi:hypothetical protein
MLPTANQRGEKGITQITKYIEIKIGSQTATVFVCHGTCLLEKRTYKDEFAQFQVNICLLLECVHDSHKMTAKIWISGISLLTWSFRT